MLTQYAINGLLLALPTLVLAAEVDQSLVASKVRVSTDRVALSSDKFQSVSSGDTTQLLLTGNAKFQWKSTTVGQLSIDADSLQVTVHSENNHHSMQNMSPKSLVGDGNCMLSLGGLVCTADRFSLNTKDDCEIKIASGVAIIVGNARLQTDAATLHHDDGRWNINGVFSVSQIGKPSDEPMSR